MPRQEKRIEGYVREPEPRGPLMEEWLMILIRCSNLSPLTLPSSLWASSFPTAFSAMYSGMIMWANQASSRPWGKAGRKQGNKSHVFDTIELREMTKACLQFIFSLKKKKKSYFWQYEHQISENKLLAYLSLKCINIYRKFKSSGPVPSMTEVRAKMYRPALGFVASQIQRETVPAKSL